MRVIFFIVLCLLVGSCSKSTIDNDNMGNSSKIINLTPYGFVKWSLYYSDIYALNYCKVDGLWTFQLDSLSKSLFGSKLLLGIGDETKLYGKKNIYLNYKINLDKNENFNDQKDRLIYLGKLNPQNHSSISIISNNYIRSNEYIHPSLAFFQNYNNIAKYWIFVSNYPNENPNYEDDDLLFSDDLSNWKRVEPISRNNKYSLLENVFVPLNDCGRENSFLPIPYSNSTIIMNGKLFRVVRSLKHDPEILYYNGESYFYNFYNFYETNDTKSPHRFTVLFKTKNFKDYQIVRTDGSSIPASNSNLLEIFTQSSVDGKNNYLRYSCTDNTTSYSLKDAAMQIVCINNIWYAYFSEYGLFENSNLSLKRYKGKSPFSFDWSNPEYCNSNRVSSNDVHTDVKFYNGKVYIIGNLYIYESLDGVHFTELKYPVIPSTMGSGYKPDVLITEDKKLLLAHGCLISTYSKTYSSNFNEMLNQSGNRIAIVNLYSYNSFDDLINQAKIGYDDAYIHCVISILTPDIKRNKIFESYYIKNKDGFKKGELYTRFIGTYNFVGDESVYVYVGTSIHKKSKNVVVQIGNVEII